MIAAVRACGERTEGECVRRVREDVQAVHVLYVAPFSEAVRECFRLAIASNAKWLLTVDADVLLDRGAVKALYAQPPQMQGWLVVGRARDRVPDWATTAGVTL